MPSTTCIRAARLTVLGALCVAGGAAMAKPLLPLGCYVRNYDAAHLAAHPAQIVQRFFLAIRYDAEYDTTSMPLAVTMADQGRARTEGFGGQSFDQSLYCFESGEGDGHRLLCGVECDGGYFELLRADGETLDLRTSYVTVGDTGSCGGAVDMAEVIGQPVTYRLHRIDDALCDEIFP